MTRPHDETDPVEHDPTGMRALLGSLGDPGPMPTDLVTRIEAALADEARRAGTWPAPAAHDGAPWPSALPADPDAAQVLTLRRRTRWQVLAVAAAVVGVLGVGGVVVQALRPGGLTASVGMSEDSADAGAASGPEVAETGARTLLAEDDELGVVVLQSGRDYSTASLAEQVRASLPWDGTGRRASSAPTMQAQAEGPGKALGPVGTAAGARSCAQGLGVPDRDTVVVDLAVVDGSPAAVLVATAESGRRTVWAVERTCSVTQADVLGGPSTIM
ncbi:hypothetical protein H9L10_13580 [Phycicoccus endophyticus]|uniref:Uncharacterized protein n=1 Tax=Phycicoccus endophyticus TaxID=1690220 RepID=A0A7G9R0W1_9MICO|nr:hypothetical protein [Phycicoccus endophyticus]NHI19528.1 hypothetical protein [Phycicoccus endophyticus]QNN49236.1 hypothetical protein H9L10_13580 [Phycicoccus endophyticus]GGL39911.1 hypothetical protein GCM10012283_22990 [Phycicoccus endophyticus]